MLQKLATSLACLLALASVPPTASAQGTVSPSDVEIEPGVRLPKPADWVVSSSTDRAGLLFYVIDKTTPKATHARVFFSSEHRASHDEAVRRLAEIASGYRNAVTTYIVIGGWPAVERRYRVPLQEVDAEGGHHPRETVPQVSIAVAAGRTVVRVDGTLSPGAPDALVDAVATAARKIEFTTAGDVAEAQRAIEAVKALPRGPREPAQPSGPLPKIVDSARVH